MRSVRAYRLTCRKINTHKGISPLVAVLECEVEEHIQEGCSLVWESDKLESFVQRFCDCIFNLRRGSIWSRYSLVINPINYNLFSVNLFVALTGFYQLFRIWRYQQGLKSGTEGPIS